MEVKPLSQASDAWLNKTWRPAMGWTYIVTCVTDFVIFPILWSLLQATQAGQVTSQWNPITLQGAGLYHMAMGAILGVAAWSRGKEKIHRDTVMYEHGMDLYEEEGLPHRPNNRRFRGPEQPTDFPPI
jgi:hypothetical protein